MQYGSVMSIMLAEELQVLHLRYRLLHMAMLQSLEQEGLLAVPGDQCPFREEATGFGRPLSRVLLNRR